MVISGEKLHPLQRWTHLRRAAAAVRAGCDERAAARDEAPSAGMGRCCPQGRPAPLSAGQGR
jgi:hypothetical protein